jgi:O-antigen/teichoic acid export membrane protein
MTRLIWSLNELAKRMANAGGSRNLQSNATNALYSIAEYIAQPLAMILAARFLINTLGVQQYGLWMLVSAIVGSIGILSTGFGDATVKYVSKYRGQKNSEGVERTIRATLTINAALGSLLGTVVWMLAPFLTYRVFKIEPGFRNASVWAIQISAIILVLRSIESVFVSTLRAFERYGPAVKLNIVLRSGVVISAVILAAAGRGVAAIMLATLFWSFVGVLLQAAAAQRISGGFSILPSVRADALQEVFRFGCFSWSQALAGIVFGYADRFVVGAMMGTAPVAIYVLCVQVTQPIHGLSAAAFNFLFPHISSRHEAGETGATTRIFRFAVTTSIVLSLAVALPLVMLSKPLLTLWMGAEFAEQGYVLLRILAVAYALLAINVVPHYTLLALGRVRYVSVVNVLGSALCLCMMTLLIPSLGLTGAALGRLLYGPVLALTLFFKVSTALSRPVIPREGPIPAST